MKELDISTWKQFRVGDLFPLVRSKAYSKKDISFADEGETINYVTRGKFNNGIKGKVKKEDKFIINPKGTISFGAENADFFYQNEPYITGNNVHYIDTRNISKYACLFLKTVLQKELSYKFSYMEGMTPNKIINEYITLPSTSNGEPDYEYMENYIKIILEKEDAFMRYVETLKLDNIYEHKINISTWKQFRVGDLFEIKRGTSRVMRNLEKGDIPLIASSTTNQGITGFYNIEPEYNNAITISCNGACGNTFYHNYDFAITGDALVMLEKENMTHLVKLFITSICNKIFTKKFSYNNKCTPKILVNEYITLPSTSNGEPDYEYMENYMMKILNEENNYANYLEEIL